MGLRADLITRRNAVASELAALAVSKPGGSPNVKDQDGGTTIDHEGYKASLYKELRELNAQLKDIAELEAIEAGNEGPFEIVTETDL